MDTALRSKDGSVHVTDERFNAASHIVGACFSLVGAALLIVQSSAQGDPWKIVAVSIFGFSLIMLFTSSALHHAIDGSPTVNEVLRTLDYGSVFLLIAGSVTPLVLVMPQFRNLQGWTVLGVIWVIAVGGIVMRSVWRQIPKWVTNTLYIALGWMVTLLLFNVDGVPLGMLLLIGAVGLAYTAGFALFVLEKPNPWPGVFGFHELWHLMVLLGAFLHYLLVYKYVLPA